MKRMLFLMGVVLLISGPAAIAQQGGQPSDQSDKKSEADYQKFRQKLVPFASFDDLKSQGFSFEATNPQPKNDNCPSHLKIESQGLFLVVTADGQVTVLDSSSLAIPATFADADAMPDSRGMVARYGKSLLLVTPGSPAPFYLTKGTTEVLIQEGDVHGPNKLDCLMSLVTAPRIAAADDNAKNLTTPNSSSSSKSNDGKPAISGAAR